MGCNGRQGGAYPCCKLATASARTNHLVRYNARPDIAGRRDFKHFRDLKHFPPAYLCGNVCGIVCGIAEAPVYPLEPAKSDFNT